MMARTGRPSQPAALKVLKGRGPGKDSAGRPIPEVPKFDRGAPDAPEWLDDVARELWDRVAPNLDRLDLLKPDDREIFAAYCESWSRFTAAVASYKSEGLIAVNPTTGRMAPHPAVAIAERAAAQLHRFAQDFGLTPAAELNLGKKPSGADSSAEADPFAGDQAAS